MKGIFAITGLALAAALLQGCATGATVAGMTTQPTTATASGQLAGKIGLARTSGGKETHPLWTSQVDAASFEQALKDSLRSSSLLAPSQGAYVLKPTLHALQQPLFGLDMTVTADVHYILREKATGKDMLDETIRSSHTAKVGDAFVGTTRLRLANEGAIRKNIEQLIKRLGELQVN